MADYMIIASGTSEHIRFIEQVLEKLKDNGIKKFKIEEKRVPNGNWLMVLISLFTFSILKKKVLN